MASREVSARLLGLREVEVDIAISYMSPVNFAKACHIPVYDLIGYIRDGSRPLRDFASWFHALQTTSAAKIQRFYRRQPPPLAMTCCFPKLVIRKRYMDDKWQRSLATEERVRGLNAAKVARSPPSMHPVPARRLTCHHTGAVSDWVPPPPPTPVAQSPVVNRPEPAQPTPVPAPPVQERPEPVQPIPVPESPAPECHMTAPPTLVPESPVPERSELLPLTPCSSQQDSDLLDNTSLALLEHEVSDR